MDTTSIVLIVFTSLFGVLGIITVIAVFLTLQRVKENSLLALRSFEVTRQSLAVLQKSLSIQVAGTLLSSLKNSDTLSSEDVALFVDIISEAFPEEKAKFEKLKGNVSTSLDTTNGMTPSR